MLSISKTKELSNNKLHTQKNGKYKQVKFEINTAIEFHWIAIDNDSRRIVD